MDKLPKKDILSLMDTYWDSYLNGAWQTAISLLDENVRIIGSTKEELYHNKTEAAKFFRESGEIAGKLQFRNRQVEIVPVGDLMMAEEHLDLFIDTGETWNYYSRIRVSTLLRNSGEGWKIIQQHGSVPDHKASEGETIGFEQVSKENQELRDAIKRRTTELEYKNRELEIEASLERIRAKVTAMRESADLLDIVVTMRSEFVKLGHEAHYFWHMRWLPATYQKAMTSGDGTRIGMVMELPRHIHGDIPLLASWEQGEESTVVYAMDTEAALDYVDKMVSLGNFQQIDPQAPSEDDIRHIGGLTFIMARTTHGEIGFSLPGVVPDPPAEALETLVRFAGVFDLAYRRFEDLKESERQKREAEIELALERVRARTMAMHHSDELSEVVALLYKQIQILGFDDWGCSIIICNEEARVMRYWYAEVNLSNLPYYCDVPLTHKIVKKTWDLWQSGAAQFEISLLGKEKEDYTSFMLNDTDYKHILPEDVKEEWRKPKDIFFSYFTFKYGLLEIVDIKALDGGNYPTYRRFVQVIEQTYTRFLDLQKAEAQARQAEIQLALERVRARTMAMQKSEELGDVIALISEQMDALQMPVKDGVALITFNEDSKDLNEWMANEGFETATNFHLPYFDHPVLSNLWKAKDEGQKELIQRYSAEESRSFLNHIFQHSDFRNTPEPVKEYCLAAETYATSIAFQKNTAIFINDYSGISLTESEMSVLHRFSKEFDQTYTRFLDLQKAEAQAREAKIEAALERVRSRTMAMHKSEELAEVATVLHTELTNLKVIEFSDASIVIFDEPNNKQIVWGARTESEYLEKSVMPLLGDQILQELYDNWHSGEAFFTVKVGGSRLKNHNEFVFPVPQRTELEDRVLKNMPDPTFFHCAVFAMGYIELMSDRELRDESALLLRRFAKVFEQTYTRFLDLKKAEAQAREAKIEAALEKIRTRTMAMQKGEELKEVAVLLYKELIALGVTNFVTCGYVEINEEIERQFTWVTAPGGDTLGLFYLPLTGDPTFDERYTAWKGQQSIFHQTVGGQERNDHLEYAITTFNSKEAEEMVRSQFPDPTVFYCFNFSHGYLHLVTGSKLKEEEEVLLARFTRVFEQTYARFLDLKKAEAQAREAQIEAALEKLRSRTMAMQKTEDISDVAVVFLDQLKELGVNFIQAWINVYHLEEGYINIWFSPLEGVYEEPANWQLPSALFEDTSLKSWRAGHTFSYLSLKSKEEVDALVQACDAATGSNYFGHFQEILKLERLEFVDANYKFGTVSKSSFEKATREEEDILHRFAKVFEQAYTRFLDLKTAEEQAREAQIENALEKVRSRTMAMQHSDELPEAANVLFLEIQALGIPAWSCGYNILAKDKKSATCIMSSEGTIQSPFKLRLKGERSFDQFGEFVASDENFMIQELEGKALLAHYDFMKSFPDLQPIFEEIDRLGLELPTYQINHLCKFNHGFLLFITYEQVPDAHDIFKRFTAVFEQTYTRFLDLKNMEAQARESKIETALERVRARALAMQEPEELREVVQVLRQEMGLLGVEELETSSIFINDGEIEKAECWFAIRDLREEQKEMVTDSISMDLEETWVGGEILEFFKSSKDQVSILMKGEARKEWISYAESHSTAFRGYYGEVIPDRTYHLYKFSHGAIGAATPGDLSGESWGLLKRAASVFSLAYSRFKDLTQARLDLQRLKEEKKRAEDALKELQLTQQQLVHAEKMASLGELTAGIAHEIQNPLNFVNNFSDVSRELLEELKDELNKGDVGEVDAIARDLMQNLEKIVHHGKRADSIVKGMLQHSRSGDGKKEPTDLNALADEYLRLAYHGLRAKDKTFNATMETDFDESIGQVNVVPQDIGRVMLNLITNAFHAVSERKEKEPEGYEPTVWVQTRKTEKGVEISVRDNGSGIPEAIGDKIFQPFFTTKPTGEGTGLGLSMSYDIVTKGHGGKFYFQSQVGTGTSFTLEIPINLAK